LVKPPPIVVRPRTIDAAIAAKKAALTQCIIDNAKGVTADMMASLSIDTAGRASSVRILPDAMNVSPVGQCLRNVLTTTMFPKSTTTQSIQFALKAKG